MSWKSSLSRHLSVLRFFGCTESPSSRGLMSWYKSNYYELKALNPTLPMMMRTGENSFPAVTTEIEFTTDDLLRYMLQTNRFRNSNGTVASDRVEAAKAYLQTDWETIRQERMSSPGFDPEKPFIDEEKPDWRDDPKIQSDLALFLELKDAADEQMKIVQSGPDKEYERAENALLMCQRVDLWCAGPAEVERAVQHLLMLGKRFNTIDPQYREYITEYIPGAGDMD
eukprot:CAMPEP_0178915378 /NCGR_PEP_ID=MMETSP0786-20121207/11993_1 /TAXON_ID=186022 /ORGANISM="Thalassionema frauenfeldii, Strain CCMP 1798" /LENGTH=225 /DNA_ID=CAMNT_0020588481 /DNA_START=63 /DNA_END=740 /DNA_ORIENTATION=+